MEENTRSPRQRAVGEPAATTLGWAAEGPTSNNRRSPSGRGLLGVVLLHLANLGSLITPQTRWFRIRAAMYRAAGASVAGDARLNGRVVIQYPNVFIGQDTWVGARTEFASTRTARIVVGDRCDISQDALFVCGSHEMGDSSRRAGRGTAHDIVVGDGTWVGARATFLGGSGVGSGSVVAAGAVVRDKFPDNVVVAGVPARVVKHLPE